MNESRDFKWDHVIKWLFADPNADFSDFCLQSETQSTVWANMV